MRRREFILLVGGAAAWSLGARAQQPALPVIGFLSAASPAEWTPFLSAFRRGLKETGFIEGQDIAIEFRWAEGQYDRLPALATDLVKRGVAVLVATGGSTTIRAAQSATVTVPIVFSTGGDPVEYGLVASLSRPGGNSTGVSHLTNVLIGKRLEILREVVPRTAAIGVLMNPNNATVQSQIHDAQASGRAINERLHILYAGSDREFESEFATLASRGIGALVVGGDQFFASRRDQLVALAARYRVPAIYEWRQFTEAGGLMSYGSDLIAGYHRAGVYAGLILKGKKPADLPVVQSTKVEFVINLKTARLLELTISVPLLGRADEVIE